MIFQLVTLAVWKCYEHPFAVRPGGGQVLDRLHASRDLPYLLRGMFAQQGFQWRAHVVGRLSRDNEIGYMNLPPPQPGKRWCAAQFGLLNRDSMFRRIDPPELADSAGQRIFATK
ncbi:MAG: hypothetical protein ONB06_06095 [candidate division KSB1 bacterium]|nr:hypothetical protein [candidate division KSB1 bacterium]